MYASGAVGPACICFANVSGPSRSESLHLFPVFYKTLMTGGGFGI
jgi:hypothetical protein